MASLCKSYHSLPPSFPDQNSNEAIIDRLHLYNLWRASKDPKLQHNRNRHLHPASERAVNRSWRLLNETILCNRHRPPSTASMALQEVPLHGGKNLKQPGHPPAGRPSLFLKDPPAEYRSDSGDDTSDLSEDDDDEFTASSRSFELGQEHRLPRPSGPCCSRYLESTSSQSDHSPMSKVTPPDPKKNIFYIENTPSPSARSSNDSRSSATYQSGATGTAPEPTTQGSHDHNPESSKPHNQHSTLHLPQSHHHNHPNHHCSTDHDKHQHNQSASFKRQDSLFSAQNLRQGLPDDVSSVSSSELSEDEERDDLDELRVRQPSTFSKSSRSMKSDNESEWVSISSEDEKNLQNSPSSQPLTFAKVVPVPVPARHAQAPPDPADLSTETVKPSPISKPRSLLSGLFLNAMADQTSTPPGNKSSNAVASKPVLKRSSTTGVITIDKGNNTHNNNNNSNGSSVREKKHLQKPSIMFSKRYASLTDISKSSLRSPVLFVEEEDAIVKADANADAENLFAKQTSSVGLSDFMASANSTANVQNLSIKDGSNKGNCENCECAISSSLSKYQNVPPTGGNSFKNFLSKSSLSLTSLFGGQGKHDRKPRPHGPRTFSNDSLRLSKDSMSEKSANSGTSAPAVERDEEHRHQPEETSSASNSSEANLSGGNLSAQNHTRSIKTSSVAAKNFEPSVEISGSLKDSLLIDHRLGKVPLPERVISDDDLFGGQDRLLFDDSNDDYHSKGW
ncbi:hypothetical protein FDK38_001329 [Candidozyma auris]|nr:hypothetical protein FDK38_001329 [[Candida] auris]